LLLKLFVFNVAMRLFIERGELVT